MSQEKNIRDSSRKVDIGIISRHVVRMKVMLIDFRIKHKRQGSTCKLVVISRKTIMCSERGNNKRYDITNYAKSASQN